MLTALSSRAPRTAMADRLSADTILDRLRAYVGPNWESHYQDSFTRLFAARRGETNAGWTWNWPGALLPIWFLYRRLYLAFFGFHALYVLIASLDQLAAGSREGGSPIALLFLGQFVLMGFVADRLFFRKAYSVVTDPAALEDAAQLGTRGRPHKWAIWVPLIFVAVGILASIR